MKILLIRHAESEKNVEGKFSSNEDKENLSQHGMEQAQKLADNIYEYLKYNKFYCSKIYAADTTRAQETANEIAKKIKAEIYVVSEFRPLKNSNKLVGISETKANEVDPVFMNELQLNRAGIFNAYNHTSNFSKKNIVNHERLVFEKFLQIIEKNVSDVIIIVLHHSSLTDIIINLARKYYDYPKEFYGVISADLCHAYIFDSELKKFELVNESLIPVG